jgi:hypothetical protein
MKLAEISISLSWLPTLLMLARVNLEHHWLVLSEIQTFSWMDLRTNSDLEIFVGDNAVTIIVKFLKQIVELLIGQCQTPMFEVKSEFFRQY